MMDIVKFTSNKKMLSGVIVKFYLDFNERTLNIELSSFNLKLKKDLEWGYS